MKSKLSKRKIKKMISSDFTSLSTNDIKALIQKEVDKGPDKADTEYIDLCFQLLSLKNDDRAKVKLKAKRPLKAVAAVAVIALVTVTTVSASAGLKLNIPENIAQPIDGNAELDYDLINADHTAYGHALSDTDLAKQIESYGISPVSLPEEMTGSDCQISEMTCSGDSSTSIFLNFNFNYKSKKGTALIEKEFEQLDESTGSRSVMDVKSSKTIRANGLDVFVFEHAGEHCSIIYKDGTTIYDLFLNCDLETALEFAKSIK